LHHRRCEKPVAYTIAAGQRIWQPDMPPADVLKFSCEVLARADDAVCRVRWEMGIEILRVSYTYSMVSRIISPVLVKFQAATPRVRIEFPSPDRSICH
jgi:hypothetical protein